MAYHEYKDDDLLDPALAEELEDEDEDEDEVDEEVLQGDKEWV